MEADPALQLTVDSLVQQSRTDGEFIIWGLCELLGKLDKAKVGNMLNFAHETRLTLPKSRPWRVMAFLSYLSFSLSSFF